MTKNNQRTIKEAINELLRTYRIDGKMAELRLINSWEKIMGVMIARHTTDIFISNKHLFVKLDSAALRQELSYGKEKIVKLLNDEAGGHVIEQIVFQ
jgi:predicted nucleic acid-binding Zn ribbon protein